MRPDTDDAAPISHAKIHAILDPLLKRADKAGRAYATSLSMAATLEMFPPESRNLAIDEATQTFRRLLPDLALRC